MEKREKLKEKWRQEKLINEMIEWRRKMDIFERRKENNLRIKNQNQNQNQNQ